MSENAAAKLAKNKKLLNALIPPTIKVMSEYFYNKTIPLNDKKITASALRKKYYTNNNRQNVKKFNSKEIVDFDKLITETIPNQQSSSSSANAAAPAAAVPAAAAAAPAPAPAPAPANAAAKAAANAEKAAANAKKLANNEAAAKAATEAAKATNAAAKKKSEEEAKKKSEDDKKAADTKKAAAQVTQVTPVTTQQAANARVSQTSLGIRNGVIGVPAPMLQPPIYSALPQQLSAKKYDVPEIIPYKDNITTYMVTLDNEISDQKTPGQKTVKYKLITENTPVKTACYGVFIPKPTKRGGKTAKAKHSKKSKTHKKK